MTVDTQVFRGPLDYWEASLISANLLSKSELIVEELTVGEGVRIDENSR